MSKTPIFVLIGGNPPKYFELFVQSIKYLKKNIPTAAVGVITPPGTGDLKGAVIDRLTQIDPKLNSSNINFIEGKKYFEDWNNSQHILDIASFAGEYDPVVYLDADTIILRDLIPFIEKFTTSGKKYGFLSDFVNDHANFKEKWEGPLFIPQTTIFFLRSENIPQLTQAWVDNWNPWIKPDPFVTIKDPAPGYKYSRVAIQQYSLGQTLFKIVQNFDAEVSVIPRSELLLCRNFDVESQQSKLKFLNAGSSYSNEGKIIVTINVQSGEVYENQDLLGGKGDPFVTVKVGEWERKTDVIKNTKAPVWNEEFVYNRSNYWEANNIVLTLWDRDGVSNNDEVGTAKLSLLGKKVHQQGNPTAYTLPLLDKNGKEQGKLKITAEFYVELLDDEGGAIKSRDLLAEGKKTAVINVVGANIYEHHDVVGDDDPYLILTVGNVTKKTKALQNTQNPVWNEEFTFDDINNTDVSIALYDQDKLTKDDLIGSGTLSLLPFKNNKSRVSVPVYDEKGKEQGKIEFDALLAVETSKAAVEAAPPPPPAPAGFDFNSLLAKIGDLAQDLTPGEEEVKGKEVVETNRSSPPEEETVEAAPPPVATKEIVEKEKEVAEAPPPSPPEKEIVEAAPPPVATKEIVEKEKEVAKAPPPSPPEEDVVVASKEAPPPPTQPPPPPAKVWAPYEGVRKVVLNVRSGKVYQSHDLVGKGDPYLKIKIGGSEKKTKVIKGSQTPVWDETFTFDKIPAAEAAKVHVQAWDYDLLTKDDSIGFNTINLLQFQEKPGHLSVPLNDEDNVERAIIEIDVALEGGPVPVPVVAASPPVAFEKEVLAKEKSAFGGVQAKAPPPAPVKTETIAVHIETAKVAKSHDFVGKGDPYIVVKVNGVEKKTTTKMNTQTPKYNERLTFDDVPVTTTQIEFNIWDENSLKSDTFIGRGFYTLGSQKNNKVKDFQLLDNKNKSAATLTFQVEIRG